MGRFEFFKEARLLKLKICIGIIMFITFIIFGIGIVDYSINCVISDVPQITILKVAEVSSDMYAINFANKKYNLNTYYLNRDLKRLKKRLAEIF